MILHGDCLTVLRTLPAASVQTIVTSPPYYGVRDFALPKTIWGTNDCEHLWGPRDLWGRKRTRASLGEWCERCGVWKGNLGHEPTPALYITHLTSIFREARRVLRTDGTFWLNIGDSPASAFSNIGVKRPKNIKESDLLGIPWMAAFALRDDGWYLRSSIIWEKPNVIPSSVDSRPTSSYEHLFLLTKSARYYYDGDAIREPVVSKGRSSGNKARKVASQGERSRLNTHIGSSVPWSDTGKGRYKRDVWRIAVKPYKGHYATFPPELAELCILAGSSARHCPHCGTPYRPSYDFSTATSIQHRLSFPVLDWQALCRCREGSTPFFAVLDPFAGAATTLVVAQQHARSSIGIELNPDFVALGNKRLSDTLERAA